MFVLSPLGSGFAFGCDMLGVLDSEVVSVSGWLSRGWGVQIIPDRTGIWVEIICFLPERTTQPRY